MTSQHPSVHFNLYDSTKASMANWTHTAMAFIYDHISVLRFSSSFLLIYVLLASSIQCVIDRRLSFYNDNFVKRHVTGSGKQLTFYATNGDFYLNKPNKTLIPHFNLRPNKTRQKKFHCISFPPDGSVQQITDFCDSTLSE